MFDAETSRFEPGDEAEHGYSDAAPFRETRRRVLLAEDDDEMRSMLATLLRRAGFEVLEAGDGYELTSKLDAIAGSELTGSSERRLDLIISDINMPGATGMEVLARLRRAHRVTPMILMTAFGDTRTHEEADRLGAEVVLDKPFALSDLLAAIESVPLDPAA